MGYVCRNHRCRNSSNLPRIVTSVWLDLVFAMQMRLLGECRGSIDTVKRMGFELKEEEDIVSGLADPSSSESQASGTCTCLVFFFFQ